MKKNKNRRSGKFSFFSFIIINISLLFIFGLLYFFQTNIFPLIPINGIIPNLFIIFILIIGLFGNNVLVISFGIISRIIY